MASVGGGAVDYPPVLAEPVEGSRGRDPALMLPEEMWCTIFEYLKDDPRDILNLSETCTHFRNLLEREEDLPGRRFEEVIPLVLKWLDKGHLLKCRGLNKRVRKAVDKVLCNDGLISSFENRNLFPRLIPPRSSPARVQSYERRQFSLTPFIDTGPIRSVEMLGELARDFEQGRINSLVTNTLSFDVSWTDGELPTMISGEMLERAVSSLTSLRDLVEQLTLSSEHYDLDEEIDAPILMYDIIRRCVSALPKLRRLDCVGFPYLSTNVPVGVTTLERYISNGHPLPQVPLEKLRIDGFELPGPLFREIVRRYSGHLKELDIRLIDDISEVDVLRLWREEYHLPVLRSLQLGNFNWRWLPLLAKMRADKLEYFYWTISDIETFTYPFSPVTLLIQVLQQIPSISRMQLQVMLWRNERVTTNHSAALEELQPGERHYNMRELQLMGFWYNIPLQFFAGLFPNLESVRIYGGSWDGIFQNRQADPELNLCFQRRFQESSLWNLLPKLQKFDIYIYGGRIDYLCTRADAEEFQSRHD